MKKQVILSPSQSAAFAMGRVLIEFETWQRLHGSAIELERAILIDFAVQHPRTLIPIAPEVKLVLEANQLAKSDFGDLFAHKHFGGMREKFISTLNDLIARALVVQSVTDEVFTVEPTNEGLLISNHLSSAYSLALRALSEVFCSIWKRRPIDDLVTHIRTILPRDTEALIALGEPFGEWMSADG